ncbi:MAG: hypothetical protein ACO1QS_01235 [Verrucomicrobiota bacterium]
MSLQDSIGGYLAKVEMRTSRTILVEGPTDKSILARLFDTSTLSRRRLLIDAAEMIKSPAGAVIGNRDKVILAHAQTRAPRAKFGCLVDREFNDFVWTPSVQDTRQNESVIDFSKFETRGHSLENYFFKPEFFCRYLQITHVSRLPENYRETVEAVFSALIKVAVKLSFAALNSNLISKISGVIRVRHWRVRSAALEIDLDGILQELQNRNATFSELQNFRRLFLEIDGCLMEASEVDRLICHGHIGWETLWSGVGAALHLNQGATTIVSTIADGDWQQKYAIVADQFAQTCSVPTCGDLRQLRDWAGSELPVA